MSIFPRLMDFNKDAQEGNGSFVLDIHNKKMNAAFLLSRKGMDYSTNKEVDSYQLTVSAYSYKVLRYDREWVESENRYVDVPVYDPNVKTLVAPISVTVYTSDKYKCMGQSNTVRDVNELKSLFGN